MLAKRLLVHDAILSQGFVESLGIWSNSFLKLLWKFVKSLAALSQNIYSWRGFSKWIIFGTDLFFARFNQVRCPMILMNRKAKQCESSELKMKGPCCRLRHSREAIFSFFENVITLQDVVPCDNIKFIPSALE